ncbi:MAG: hypothetical protein ACTSPY_15740 [Candidatus Helarchaeota archaeon]
MTSEESSMVKILTGILEDSVEALRRIEKHILDQNRLINDLMKRINIIENKFETGFNTITNSSLPNFEKNISEKMKSLETSTLDELGDLLNSLVNKLKKNLQILTIQDIVQNIDELTLKIKGKSPAQKGHYDKGENKKVSDVPQAKAASSTSQAVPQPIEDAPEEPVPIEKDEDEDHLVRPSSFFG